MCVNEDMKSAVCRKRMHRSGGSGGGESCHLNGLYLNTLGNAVSCSNSSRHSCRQPVRECHHVCRYESSGDCHVVQLETDSWRKPDWCEHASRSVILL